MPTKSGSESAILKIVLGKPVINFRGIIWFLNGNWCRTGSGHQILFITIGNLWNFVASFVVHAMSDNFDWKRPLGEDFRVTLGECPSHLGYLLQQRNGAHLVVKIPYKVILKWREIKSKPGINVSYQELLSLSGESLPFGIKPYNQRIEDCLSVSSSKIYSQSRGLRGYNRVG